MTCNTSAPHLLTSIPPMNAFVLAKDYRTSSSGAFVLASQHVCSDRTRDIIGAMVEAFADARIESIVGAEVDAIVDATIDAIVDAITGFSKILHATVDLYNDCTQ